MNKFKRNITTIPVMTIIAFGSMAFALSLQDESSMISTVIVTKSQWVRCNTKLMTSKQLRLLDIQERDAKNMIINVPLLINKTK